MMDYIDSCTDCDSISEYVDETQNMTLQYIGYVNRTLDGEFCPEISLDEQATGLANI